MPGLTRQVRHALDGREGGVDGSFGIVAIGDGRAEDRHHAVADVFVDVAPILLHDPVDASEECLEDKMNLLGVGRPAQGRVTGEIGKKRTATCLRAGSAVTPDGGLVSFSAHVDRRAAIASSSLRR
jgi:hypothetical protein